MKSKFGNFDFGSVEVLSRAEAAKVKGGYTNPSGGGCGGGKNYNSNCQPFLMEYKGHLCLNTCGCMTNCTMITTPSPFIPTINPSSGVPPLSPGCVGGNCP